MRIFIFCLCLGVPSLYWQVCRNRATLQAHWHGKSRRNCGSTEIDSFKQASYSCVPTLQCGWTSSFPPSKQEGPASPSWAASTHTHRITQGTASVLTQPKKLFVCFPVGFHLSPEPKCLAWGSEDTTDSTKWGAEAHCLQQDFFLMLAAVNLAQAVTWWSIFQHLQQQPDSTWAAKPSWDTGQAQREAAWIHSCLGMGREVSCSPSSVAVPASHSCNSSPPSWDDEGTSIRRWPHISILPYLQKSQLLWCSIWGNIHLLHVWTCVSNILDILIHPLKNRI